MDLILRSQLHVHKMIKSANMIVATAAFRKCFKITIIINGVFKIRNVIL